MSLPSGSIRRPVAVAMLFAAVVFLGFISFSRLPIDLLPDVAYPRLVVYTTYPNVAPAEVERFVTEPIEQAVSRVPGVERVESVSREGASLVTLRFSWGTDMEFAALNVREQLDNLRDALPELADRPSVLRTDPTADPVMTISVAGGSSLWSLRDLTESVFKRRLEQIDGVAQATVTGGLEREIQVEIDPNALETYDLDINRVADALAAANVSAPGGTVLRGRYRYSLRTLGEFESVEQIGDVVVGGTGTGAAESGQEEDGVTLPGVIRLRDVATVTDGWKERESVARFNGEEAVGLLLYKESGANSVRVAERVREVLEQLRAEHEEVSLEVATSEAGFIRDAISNVVSALVYGGVLAFLVLFLFLRDPRYPVAVALAIPISVIGTFALMDAFGVSLNIMSLGGLALGVGMLVDNSIVVIENVFRHREEGAGGAAREHGFASGVERTAASGAEEVQGAITASTLTTIAVFGPILYVEGVAGELFGALSLAVACSLLVSLVVALMVLPALAARWGHAAHPSDTLLRRGMRRIGHALGRVLSRAFSPMLDAFDRRFDRFAEWYHRVLEWSLAHRGRVVGVTLGVLALTLLLGATLERSVLPDVDQGAFQARIDLPLGTPIDRTSNAARRLESMLMEDPDVEAVFSRVGRQETLGAAEEQRSGLNTALVDVRLAGDAATEDVLNRLRPRIRAAFGAGVVAIETGQATALGRLLGGTDADVVVRVEGDDLSAMLDYAGTLNAALAADPALANVRMGIELGQPEVRVQVDREAAASYGIAVGDVASAVETSMHGLVATEFVDFDRQVPVVVRLPEDARRSPETLRRLRVAGVPLSQLVHTEATVGPSEVRRLEQTRVVPVLADVAEGGLAGAIERVNATIARVGPPAGVDVEVGGANEELRRSFGDLLFAFGLALLLVYMIMAAQFESFSHPLTILFSVPLAIIGALVALWMTGAGLNTMSLIGVVILIGIVVNDAIVKVDYINQLRGRGLTLRDAIMEAGRARLRPIVMTTVTTVLGLTPLALGIGRGADLRAPLGIAVIGGLISATALTLIVVPVVYSLVDGVALRKRARATTRGAEEDIAPDLGAPASVGGVGPQ